MNFFINTALTMSVKIKNAAINCSIQVDFLSLKESLQN